MVALGKGEVVWLIDFLGLSKEKLANPDSFNERLKFQKAVFLLKHLDFSPFRNYGFSMYLRGPYSPELAGDYYNLEGVSPVPIELGDKKELLNWFVSHDMKWLEIASSIISITDSYREIPDSEIYDILHMSKPWVKKDDFQKIINELGRMGLR